MRDRPRVRGLNHVTLAVADLERSLSFYRDVLGCEVAATWASGAYLSAGPLWLCLSVDPATRSDAHPDYTHLAFTVAPHEFEALAATVRAVATQWQSNRSEGNSLYLLDPDHHKIELHVGDLASRLSAYRERPPEGFRLWSSLDNRKS